MSITSSQFLLFMQFKKEPKPQIAKDFVKEIEAFRIWKYKSMLSLASTSSLIIALRTQRFFKAFIFGFG